MGREQSCLNQVFPVPQVPIGSDIVVNWFSDYDTQETDRGSSIGDWVGLYRQASLKTRHTEHAYQCAEGGVHRMPANAQKGGGGRARLQSGHGGGGRRAPSAWKKGGGGSGRNVLAKRGGRGSPEHAGEPGAEEE